MNSLNQPASIFLQSQYKCSGVDVLHAFETKLIIYVKGDITSCFMNFLPICLYWNFLPICFFFNLISLCNCDESLIVPLSEDFRVLKSLTSTEQDSEILPISFSISYIYIYI